MRYQKSATMELKRGLSTDIKKEIIAFANGNGGTILVGIADNGQISGVSDTGEVIRKVSALAKNTIKPDVTVLIHCSVETIHGKDVVRIDVEKGTSSPYYLVEKGLCPAGVFVRKGSSSIAASNIVIRRMMAH